VDTRRTSSNRIILYIGGILSKSLGKEGLTRDKVEKDIKKEGTLNLLGLKKVYPS